MSTTPHHEPKAPEGVLCFGRLVSLAEFERYARDWERFKLSIAHKNILFFSSPNEHQTAGETNNRTEEI